MNKHNDADILTPDWSYWGSLKTTTLFQAVLLSFDICPDWFANAAAKDPSFRLSAELSDELFKFLRICENRAVEFDGWLAIMPEENRSKGKVDLATFGTWARTVWNDLPRELPGRDVEAEPVAKGVQLKRQKIPNTEQASRTRTDGLSLAMQAGIVAYREKHRAEPSARALFDFIANHDETNNIEEFDADKDKLTWRRADGGLSDTTFKSFQGRFTNLIRK
ncbi:hypothetical protein [Quatrionicoccus australiensis]|uniref:hypothetical protein n=1 Tax=Quatrionicoccus australiensis TaxID=138118 RepID=UPI001CF998FF|nr:hypothetical protein [Quatrionicoccus australiensis]MCB4360923.1 hypothetical protein [Quatrionicoccus australiensis]